MYRFMKKNIFKMQNLTAVVGSLLMFGSIFGLSSCKESIDESNFAIKSELTLTDYLTTTDNLSMITEIFGKVRLGNDSASFMTAVLSARGNYTVFAPTNAAVEAYLAEEGLTSIEEMNREQLEQIAKSCVIDNGDLSAFETAEFPTKGAFSIPNLNNRELSCEEKTDSLGIVSYIINGTSLVVEDDIDLSNGVIHVVETVVNPSSDYLAKSIGLAGNMKVMGRLLTETAWADTLNKKEYNLDVEYEKQERELIYNLNQVAPFTVVQHRYIGFTAFVEPDSVYEEWLGLEVEADAEGNITNWDAILAKLTEKCAAVYGTTGGEADNDLTHADNAVNKFVAYHLIYGKMAYNKLVAHFNEYGYKYGDITRPQTSSYPTNVWDYYSTMGKHRRLLKITQVGDLSLVDADQGKRIYVNRISEYANGRTDNYHEKGVKSRGVLITDATNGEFDNNALNGYYYPVDQVLLYDNTTRNLLASERMRIDVNTMLPEILTNNIRGGGFGNNGYARFPNGYFDNIFNESDDTKLLYLHAARVGGTGWNDYQGDEFMVSGLYDFTMKLPPVPVDGTYELRMGVAQNSLRGMCQIYFGDDPDRLTPAGLPYDMRQKATADNVAIPWVADGEDDLVNAENDKNLRNQGYMKGPNYHCLCDGTAETPIRQRGGEYAALRRIITTANMDADKTYYLRFKTALKKADSQFFMDFFEIVPTSVYNGALPEDIW